MDLKNIDQWSRVLLQNEASKRGVRTPELYSRPELVRLILKHDYASARSVREAAKLVGGIFGSAKLALRGIVEGRQEPERVRRQEPERVRREVVPRETVSAPSPPLTAAAPTPVVTGVAPSASNTAVSPWDPPHIEDPKLAPAPPPRRPEPVADAPEELTYGPHPNDGLLLQWNVGSDAIHRARAVLGAHGELALRVVTIRVDDGLYVRSETLDHGPIDSAGRWVAPLVPNAGRYVSSVGLRSGDRFVSIIHAASA